MGRWDNRAARKGEPSTRFYDIVISGTLGMFIGIVVTLWVLINGS